MLMNASLTTVIVDIHVLILLVAITATVMMGIIWSLMDIIVQVWDITFHHFNHILRYK